MTFLLSTSDGNPASEALVAVSEPGTGKTMWSTSADVNGRVTVPIAALRDLTSPERLAQKRVNYLLRAYLLPDGIESPGTYDADVAMIGMVLDPATNALAGGHTVDGDTVVMRRQPLQLDAAEPDADDGCEQIRQLLQESLATCRYEAFWDADLSNVRIPFVFNYGGGLDWVSTLQITTSKTIVTDFARAR